MAKLRILSLNLRAGGGNRSDSLLDWMLGRRPDIMILSEWRTNPAGARLSNALRDKGFSIATACSGRANANGLLLAARNSIVAKRITPLDGDRGELILGRIGDNFRMLAAYFPQRQAKAPFFRRCIDEVRAANAAPFLLVGDLNTGNSESDIEGSGTRFHCADLFAALEQEAGLIDLWRHRHGDQREWSWRSAKNGFRIDHAFANEAFLVAYKPMDCRYDHEPRNSGMTDHSALLIDTAMPVGSD